MQITNQELKRLKYIKRSVEFLEGAEREAALAECERLKKFIQGIPDIVTRDIFSLRYEKNWTWAKIALHYGWADESSPRKIMERFLKKL